MIELTGFNEIINSLDTIKRGLDIHALNRLNMERARNFYKYVSNRARRGLLGLEENTATTRKIQGSSHSPMFFKGELMKAMTLKNETDFASCGFFAKDASRPTGKKLTWYEIALIHTTGYKIPTDPLTDKGKKVRRFFAAHGIFLKSSTKSLTVPARDIMGESAVRYQKSDEDFNVVNTYFHNMLKRSW